MILVTFSERRYLNSGCSIPTKSDQVCVNSDSSTTSDERCLNSASVMLSDRRHFNCGSSTLYELKCMNCDFVTPLEQRYFISICNPLSEQTCYIRPAMSD